MTALEISYQANNLSEDCGQIAADQSHPETPIISADLLVRLRSFEAVPTIDLLDAKATTVLKIEGNGEFTVRNEAGQLFMIQSPASENSQLMRSPEEIVQFLDDEFSPEDVVETEKVVVRTSKARAILNSPILLVTLALVFDFLLFRAIQPEGPEGVTLVSDSARVATFTEQFAGRYGAVEEDGDVLYLIEADRFKVFEVTDEGLDPEPFMDEAILFGQRDGLVVLVLGNGAVIERSATGDLVFGDETYPRLP